MPLSSVPIFVKAAVSKNFSLMLRTMALISLGLGEMAEFSAPTCLTDLRLMKLLLRSATLN